MRQKSTVFSYALRLLCGLGFLNQALFTDVFAYENPLNQNETIDNLSVNLEADQLIMQTEQKISLKGNAVFEQNDLLILAENIEYELPEWTLEANTDVILVQGETAFKTPHLKINTLNAAQGNNVAFIEDTDFVIFPKKSLTEKSDEKITKIRTYFDSINDKELENTLDDNVGSNTAKGFASQVSILDQDEITVKDACYTTCATYDDWFVTAEHLNLDRFNETATAKDVSLTFKGATIAKWPYFKFPIGEKRQSGLLTPSYGATSQGGFELLIPIYWNLSPNYDITFYPKLISKRGLQLGGEWRYLKQEHQGQFYWEFLSKDTQTKKNRYWLNASQQFDLNKKFNFLSKANLNNWKLYWNYQKASDDNYFVDFSRNIFSASQRYLPQSISLVGDITQKNRLSIQWQRYQTLQDPLSPLPVPYQQIPHINWKYSDQKSNEKNSSKRWNWSIENDGTNFKHPTLVSGNRLWSVAQLNYRQENSYSFIQPKVKLHTALYQTNNGISNSNTGINSDSKTQHRFLPNFSLDGGLFFERKFETNKNNENGNGNGNKSWTQTLEPRLFYNYIPYKNQDNLPVFDTGISDFNLTQIFTENRFVGEDRIGDANQLTLLLNSRIKNELGETLAKLGVGQRFNFSPERVNLPGVPAISTTFSDLLLFLESKMNNRWSLDFNMQYTPQIQQIKRANIQTRYEIKPRQFINLSYRFGNVGNNLLGGTNLSEFSQVELSTQYPISKRWYGISRINYSLQTNQISESLGGLEYNGGCWAIRAVAHRFATATNQFTNAFFLQLELDGLVKIGNSPIRLLQQNVPGYVPLLQRD